jgi:hypothetical protein
MAPKITPPPNFKFWVFFSFLNSRRNSSCFKKCFFYRHESSCAIERHLDVGCHDPGQSLFSDVGANANIVDVVFPTSIVK